MRQTLQSQIFTSPLDCHQEAEVKSNNVPKEFLGTSAPAEEEEKAVAIEEITTAKQPAHGTAWTASQ